ncbi:MAG: ExbD/TolR family protein [Brevinema sp.]
MFSKYKPKNHLSSDINMTPMIDIVFQLLTFFMITSTFIQTSSLNVDLPKAQTSDAVAQQQFIINVDKNNTLTWNSQVISKNDLPSILKDFKAKNPDSSIVIQGDETIAYGLLVEIMDYARIAGIEKLSLATILKK